MGVDGPGADDAGALTLTIDELVVHGLDRRGARRLAGALERELVRLVERHGLPPRLGGGAAELALDPLTVGEGASPGEVGRAVAAAIYGRLGK